MHPSKAVVGRGELHPDGVCRVVGKLTDVGHHYVLVLVDGKRVDRQMRDIFFRLLTDEHDGVALHHEVVAIGVVMGGGEGYGIHLALSVVGALGKRARHARLVRIAACQRYRSYKQE